VSEAQEKYAKWHARQFELGACNCRECKARRSGGKEERAAPVVAPESPNFAVASRSDGLATAPPAPDAWFPPAPDDEHDIPFLQPGVVLPIRRDWQTVEYSSDGFVLRYNKLLPERVSFIPWNDKLARCKQNAYPPDAEEEQRKRDEAALDRAHLALQYRRERQEWQDKYAREAEAAAHAKLSYEEARTRLEREFGVEAVGKAIDGLSRLLDIRDDVDRLADRASELSDSAVELRESLIDLRGKLDGED